MNKGIEKFPPAEKLWGSKQSRNTSKVSVGVSAVGVLAGGLRAEVRVCVCVRICDLYVYLSVRLCACASVRAEYRVVRVSLSCSRESSAQRCVSACLCVSVSLCACVCASVCPCICVFAIPGCAVHQRRVVGVLAGG